MQVGAKGKILKEVEWSFSQMPRRYDGLFHVKCVITVNAAPPSFTPTRRPRLGEYKKKKGEEEEEEEAGVGVGGVGGGVSFNPPANS